MKLNSHKFWSTNSILQKCPGHPLLAYSSSPWSARPKLCVSDLDVAKRILGSKGSKCFSPTWELGKGQDPGYQRVPEGLSSALSDPSRLKPLKGIVQSHVDRLVEYMSRAAAEEGRALDLRPLLARFAMEVLASLAFDLDPAAATGGGSGGGAENAPPTAFTSSLWRLHGRSVTLN